MLVIAIVGIIVWALWESYTTSREYIERKNPYLVQQRKWMSDETDRINANYREGMKKVGSPVAKDYEYFPNIRKDK